MSSSNLPKVVLRSPLLNDNNEDSSVMTIKNDMKFQEVVLTSGAQAIQEMHQNRMKNLRKEMDYLKETEWKYNPIDKYIGQ